MQLLFAGSDSQGLRYGTVGTPEKYFVQWKAQGADPSAGYLLDLPLAEMCEKSRLLDLVRNFIIFDAGQKKVPRQHQFVGVKAAQERVRQREGGVIWHTQGSGKSILMVLLAKWLLEHDPDARVLIITDRDELDKQIEGVMRNAGVIGEDSPSPRITKRAELVEKLGAATPRAMCALVHKFDPADLNGRPPPVHGNRRAGHIRLNTELVKKPKDLLEYVIVHEMAHLIERAHNDRFIALLDDHYPTWREARAELNELPLTAQEWKE